MAGQIIKRGEKTWTVRIFNGRDANGKRKYVNKTIHGTKKDAQKYLTAKLREKDLGVFIEPTRKTLNEHLDEFLKIIKPRIAEQTYNSYERVLRVHLRPKVGELKLPDIKILTVQKVYAELQEAELSPRTIHYVHALWSMAMKKAVELGQIANNPCVYAELPRQNRKERKAFSPAQAQKFLECARDDKHGLVFEIALSSGMRPEEYLSLQWSDISFEKGTATIQRALVWRQGGGFTFCEPKTASSRRTIPLPKSILPKLKEHKRRQLEHRLKLGSAYENHNLVFASETGRPLSSRNLTQRHFEKILERAGLKDAGFVLYSLRHSCATLLLSAGENPKIVAERLGHSSVKMTLDTYSHVLPDMQQSATDKLETMLYRKFGTV
jgi:integrase